MSDASPADFSQEMIREFVIAAHGDLAKVQAMLAEHPALLTVRYDWGDHSYEDGLGAAAHIGNRAIAEFFLSQGVPLTICAAAMLGQFEAVEAFLKADPTAANARGAHDISLMFHTALSGSVKIAQLLHDYGCHEGYSHALHGAISYGHKNMVAWLLAKGVQDVNMADYQGKTPLASALETGHSEIADLLRAHGAQETP